MRPWLKGLRIVFTLCAITVFVLSACDTDTTPSPEPQEQQQEPQPKEQAPEEPAPPPTEEPPPPTNTPVPTPTEPPPPAQPPERQEITITTSDGRELFGYYYPAAVEPAPTIVMMHWAPGTLEDWQALAPWLQNRGNDEPRNEVLSRWGDYMDFIIGPWLDETWFPALPADASFALVVFDYSGCGNSPGSGSASTNLEDSSLCCMRSDCIGDISLFSQGRGCGFERLCREE